MSVPHTTAMLRLRECLPAERARAQSCLRVANSHVAAVMGNAFKHRLLASDDWNATDAIQGDGRISTIVRSISREKIPDEVRAKVEELLSASADHLNWTLREAFEGLQHDLTECIDDVNEIPDRNRTALPGPYGTGSPRPLVLVSIVSSTCIHVYFSIE